MDDYVGKTCPYCKTEIKTRESGTVKICEFCNTPHHADCYEANEGCSTSGCSGQNHKTQKTADIAICKSCGAVFEEGDSFCTKCGSPIANEPVSSAHTCTGCGAVFKEGNSFCIKCGQRVADIPYPLPYAPPFVPKKSPFLERALGSIKKSIFFRKKKNFIITLSSLFLVIAIIIGSFYSGLFLFPTAFDNGDFFLAKSIYNLSEKNTYVKNQLDNYLSEKANSCYDDFFDQKITAAQAIELIQQVGKYMDVKSIEKKIKFVKDDRDFFDEAQEYFEDKDYKNAYLSYCKVSNLYDVDLYKEAAKNAVTTKTLLFEEILPKLREYEKAKDYAAGLELIESMKDVLGTFSGDNPNQKEYYELNQSFEVMKQKALIEEYKNTQKVTVTSVRSLNTSAYIIWRKCEVVIKNVSDKTITEYNVKILQFNNSGSPVKVEYFISSIDNSFIGNSDKVNVKPGQSYGTGYGWSVDDGATKVKACVESVTFSDGTTWKNPYCEYWYEQEKDKY